MGKTGRKNKVYSAEFKIGVIMDMREHKLPWNWSRRESFVTSSTAMWKQNYADISTITTAINKLSITKIESISFTIICF